MPEMLQLSVWEFKATMNNMLKVLKKKVENMQEQVL